MLRSVSGMRGFTIHATDGDIGSVDEFLFDDEQWTVRYLVVNTGGWLTGRLVLVSPIAFRSVDWDRETFDVALTRQQVEEYSRYYGYPYYWDGLGLWGAGMYPRMASLSTVNSTYGDGEAATARRRSWPCRRFHRGRRELGAALHGRG